MNVEARMRKEGSCLDPLLMQQFLMKRGAHFACTKHLVDHRIHVSTTMLMLHVSKQSALGMIYRHLQAE